MTTPTPKSSSLNGALFCVAIMGALWAGASRIAPSLPDVWLTLALLGALGAVCWFDIDHFRIPNWISYPLIVTGVALSIVLASPGLIWRLAGAGVGYGFIWMLNTWWKRHRGREGIGMGDAKLLSAAGAWLGLAALPVVTLVASASALVWIVGARLIRAERVVGDEAFPFGPFLSIGFFAVWVFSASLPFQY